MLRAYFVLVGGLLTGAFLLAAILATSVEAGMSADLANCTAAKDRAAAAACTRVMNSGRLHEAQTYIGYFNRGTAYRSAGDFAKSIADYTRVVEMKPGFARAYEARGLVKAEQGNRSDAMADLDESVRRGGDDWRMLYSRAVVLRSSGDYEAAMADLDAAAKRKRDGQLIAMMRAMLLADQGDYQSARGEINRLLARGRDDAIGHYARAAVAFREGRTLAAEADVDRAIALRSEFASARTLKARLQEERGDREGARVNYQKALSVAPDSFDGLSSRLLARERLAVIGDVPQKERAKNLAAATIDASRPADCKVFLPSTGSVVTAKCNE
ncbi:MAG: tetratricopeptide repeat protein [Hyphomicrobium sp.]